MDKSSRKPNKKRLAQTPSKPRIGTPTSEVVAGDESALAAEMLRLLVCPLTKQKLDYDIAKSELRSASARLAYPVRGGVPILLPSEARPLSDDEIRNPAAIDD